MKNNHGYVNTSLDFTINKEELNEFDPLRDLLVAQSSKPNELGEINLRVLTPFQRALLVIDGTVTKFIEAYTMDPIEIIRLSQTNRQIENDHPWLEADRGTEVIARQVLLQGKYSYRLYAYAASLLVPSRLPENILRGLDVNGEGLGRLLVGSRMETYREILWFGKEHLKNLPDSIRHMESGEYLSRTYRILADGKPLMLINEKFPYGEDPLPYHH